MSTAPTTSGFLSLREFEEFCAKYFHESEVVLRCRDVTIPYSSFAFMRTELVRGTDA